MSARPICERFQIRLRRIAEKRNLLPQFVRVAVGSRAAAELQIHICARLAKPNRALGSPKLDESQIRFEHFDDGLEILRIETIGDVIELRWRLLGRGPIRIGIDRSQLSHCDSRRFETACHPRGVTRMEPLPDRTGATRTVAGKAGSTRHTGTRLRRRCPTPPLADDCVEKELPPAGCSENEDATTSALGKHDYIESDA